MGAGLQVQGFGNLFYLPAAICYRVAYLLHHRFFLRPGKPLQHAKLIIVGSHRAGGAGKTPFCIWLASYISRRPAKNSPQAARPRIAILCHQYAYDEIAMLRREFLDQPHIAVVGTRNRYRSTLQLDSQFDYIICDDGFEDSRLPVDITFALQWEPPPKKIRDLWPAGKNRSLAKDHLATGLSRTIPLQCSGESPDVSFTITSITNDGGQVLPRNSKAIILCGLGDPRRFIDDIRNYGISIRRSIVFKDHYRYFAHKMELMLKIYSTPIIISGKDACRLTDIQEKDSRVFVARQSCTVSEACSKIIEQALG